LNLKKLDTLDRCTFVENVRGKRGMKDVIDDVHIKTE